MADELNREPNLSILVSSNRKLVLSSALREDVREFRLMSKADVLGDTVETLRDVKDLVETLDIESLDTIASALHEVFNLGSLIAYALLGCPRQVTVFCEYAQACLATEDPIEAPPLVDINTPPDICFPFELLPLLSFDGPNIETFADLQPAAALLPGFRAIIRRTDATASLPQAANLRGTPKVPFRLFRYGSLEADLFTRLGDVLEVRRPWPEQPLERKRAVRAFGDLIFTAGTSVDSSPDQIQHFACHCEGGAGSGGHPSISLAPAPSDPDKDPDDEIELLLEKLIPGLLNHWTPSLAKPLVFLNACESAAIPTSSILSLPKLFLDNGNPVYIGTECRVPRNVAARLSERFYYHLLKPGIAPTGTGDYQRVGMALHLAKWDLLLLHGNPAGIMYTLYGDPNVGIERATTNGD